MSIIIAGCGKVGTALAEQLCLEKHDIVIIDPDESRLGYLANTQDVMCIAGDAKSVELLRSAGVDHCDLILAMTADDEENLMICLIAKELGAKGYLPKNVDHRRLISAVEQAAANGPFQEEPLPEVPNMLTAREMAVLKYLALGKTREEVGIILGVSPETVKSHSKSIQLKLGAPNTAGAVSRAYELGLLRA